MKRLEKRNGQGRKQIRQEDAVYNLYCRNDFIHQRNIEEGCAQNSVKNMLEKGTPRGMEKRMWVREMDAILTGNFEKGLPDSKNMYNRVEKVFCGV